MISLLVLLLLSFFLLFFICLFSVCLCLFLSVSLSLCVCLSLCFNLTANFTTKSTNIMSWKKKEKKKIKKEEKDMCKTDKAHLFLVDLLFFSFFSSSSRTLHYVIKRSLHRDTNSGWETWLQSPCISPATCTQNWELQVCYRWHQRHFSDGRMNAVIRSWVSHGVRKSHGIKSEIHQHAQLQCPSLIRLMVSVDVTHRVYLI